MASEFRLHHGSATTEKAAQAAGRVEVIVGDVVNGNRKAWGRIDVEDIALLVQHARDAAASPDWLSKMAIDTLVTHGAAAAQRAEAAEAALVLACPHCGPEHFAGPDADGACAMCMGTLIRTDAAGAVLAHELYNGAHVAEAALATARAEGAAAERAAAERAAVLGALRAQLAYAATRGWPEAVEMLEECIEDIEASAHVRPVEGA